MKNRNVRATTLQGAGHNRDRGEGQRLQDPGYTSEILTLAGDSFATTTAIKKFSKKERKKNRSADGVWERALSVWRANFGGDFPKKELETEIPEGRGPTEPEDTSWPEDTSRGVGTEKTGTLLYGRPIEKPT